MIQKGKWTLKKKNNCVQCGQKLPHWMNFILWKLSVLRQKKLISS